MLFSVGSPRFRGPSPDGRAAMRSATTRDGGCSRARLVARHFAYADAAFRVDQTFPAIARSAIEDSLVRGQRITFH